MPYKFLAQLLDARTSPVAGPFGPVKDGYVTLKGPLIALRRSTDPQRYKNGEQEVGALAFHMAHVHNLAVDNGEELKSIRYLKEFHDWERFDCWNWPEMGKKIYLACLHEDWGTVNGLLLARSDSPDGGEAGYARMGKVVLEFERKKDEKDENKSWMVDRELLRKLLRSYLERHEQEYTIY